MQEIERRKAPAIGWRLLLPKIVRVVALVALVAGIVFVGITIYKRKDIGAFRLKRRPAQLSTEVVGIVEGYERRMMDGERLHVLLRAARDVTYSDGHHELENVYIEVYPKGSDKPDKIRSQRTISNDDNTVITFTGNVNIETHDKLTGKTEALDYDLKNEIGHVKAPFTFERENVRGRADAAAIDAKNKKMDMMGSVEITVQPQVVNKEVKAKLDQSRSRPVTIRSAQANFNQATMQLIFTGGATAEQDRDIMSGDTLSGTLNEQKKLQKIEARGNSYLRTMTEGRAAEVNSVNMDFFFDGDQLLERALASTNVRARTLNADSEVQLTSAGDVNVDFMAQGERSILKELRAGARPVITMAAPKSRMNDSKAANKRLTADEVKLFWRATAGQDLERAEAVGNAELFVDPVQQTGAADRKTITAPRFDGEFYEKDNLARLFTATGGAKVVIEPVQPTPKRGTRTLTSQKMTAQFTRETQGIERVEALGDAKFNERERNLTSDKMIGTFAGAQQELERVEAQGNVKFNENDRNAQAATATYTAADEYVRLRGGEPVVWDSRARMKAPEIDSDTRNKISYGRGKASTTYYNQEQTGGSTPFSKVKSPVFIVANSAEIHHEKELAIYTGDARAWQDDNFVKADKLTLYQDTKRMEGEGNVESALYQARRKDPKGASAVVPVFATANRMTYTDTERLLQYIGAVDIKQGTERITSDTADVYLMKDAYEVERTIAKRNVVVTQPGKRGTGEQAEYTAADETVILMGAPARVEDAEQGNSESRRLTIYLRQNRVVSDGGDNSKQSSGRVRSTHKVKKQ